MANEIRLRRNNISGAINDNPLLVGATTINSPSFADLPVVDATNHLILVLDPLEIHGAAEVVRVTAHTAAATSLTVVRGAEGSVARQHPLATVWFHSPVTSDWEVTATSGTRPAVPYTGESIYETDTNRYVGYTGTAWQQKGLFFDPPACRVFSNAAISVPDNGSANITCNQERFDTDNMHDNAINNHLITINTAGIYMVGAGAQLAVASDYQRVFIAITVPGTGDIAYSATRAATLAGYGEAPLLVVNTVWKFTAGQTFNAYVFQDNGAGAARNVTVAAPQGPEVWACWIGRGN